MRPPPLPSLLLLFSISWDYTSNFLTPHLSHLTLPSPLLTSHTSPLTPHLSHLTLPSPSLTSHTSPFPLHSSPLTPHPSLSTPHSSHLRTEVEFLSTKLEKASMAKVWRGRERLFISTCEPLTLPLIPPPLPWLFLLSLPPSLPLLLLLLLLQSIAESKLSDFEREKKMIELDIDEILARHKIEVTERMSKLTRVCHMTGLTCHVIVM